MPGLMSLRANYGPSQPFRGARITGSFHLTLQTVMFIETLSSLAASVRWCSSNPMSTQDHAAAAVTRDTAPIFAWKGQTLEEYWWCLGQALDSGGSGGGPHLVVDNGGDATLLVHEGVKAEQVLEATGNLPDPESTDDVKLKSLLALIRNGLADNTRKYRRMKQSIIGVVEDTAVAIHRLYAMQQNGILFPAINIDSSITKAKVDNYYGCRQSFPNSLIRTTDILIAGRRAVVCGYGVVGKACAFALQRAGAHVMVTEIDPICALEASMEGISVVKMEDVVQFADLFVTTTENKDVIRLDHMKQMKDNAIICNMTTSEEIYIAGLQQYPGIRRVFLKPHVELYAFPETDEGVIILANGQVLNVGCSSGHPSLIMSCTFSTFVLALLDLWMGKDTGMYDNELYKLRKLTDERIARLHLAAFGATLTELSEEQATYLGVPIEGPYKDDDYLH